MADNADYTNEQQDSGEEYGAYSRGAVEESQDYYDASEALTAEGRESADASSHAVGVAGVLYATLALSLLALIGYALYLYCGQLRACREFDERTMGAKEITQSFEMTGGDAEDDDGVLVEHEESGRTSIWVKTENDERSTSKKKNKKRDYVPPSAIDGDDGVMV